MSNQQLDQIIATLQAAVDRKTFRAIDFFHPYPKQELFFEMGAFKRERLFRAGNQLGKTFAGAAEMAYHLTGRYPVGWKGRKFDHPIKAWAAGVKSAATREGPQSLLCGQFGVAEAFGTGFIPARLLRGQAPRSAAASLTPTIRSRSSTTPTASTTAYRCSASRATKRGRYKFQGATLDVIWCDEEPPDRYLFGVPGAYRCDRRLHLHHLHPAARPLDCGRSLRHGDGARSR